METKALNLSKLAKYFSDEMAARVLLESLRWPDGPHCPICNQTSTVYRMQPRPGSKKPGRQGLLRCRGCTKQFTVTAGTVFEDSHIPLSKWLLALHLLCSSKKGMSAHQLGRMLGLGSYRSAWFMAHRLRYAMTDGPMADLLSGIIEADETYVGAKQRSPGLLPPIRADFKHAVKAMLQTPAGDYVKGSRAVNLKAKPTRKRARKKVRSLV